MGIVFGIGLAFGAGGVALTQWAVGVPIFGASLLFGEKEGNPSIFVDTKVIYPCKSKRQNQQSKYSKQKDIFQWEQQWPNRSLGLEKRRYK